MARMTVQRQADKINNLRKVHIIVDGVDFVALNNGEKKVINLPPGVHEIEAKMSVFGSRKKLVTLSDSGDFSLQVKSHKHADFANVTMACITPIYLLALIPYTGVVLTAASALLLYMLYMMVIGRHRYLEIIKE